MAQRHDALGLAGACWYVASRLQDGYVSALAMNMAVDKALQHGVGVVGVVNSHHFGAAAYHLAPVAKAGMVGLAFSNSPAAMNAWRSRCATSPATGCR